MVTDIISNLLFLYIKFIKNQKTIKLDSTSKYDKFILSFFFYFKFFMYIHLTRIGLPAIVKNCSINNQTQHTIEVQCLAGFDGGLPQVFVLEFISTRTGKVR